GQRRQVDVVLYGDRSVQFGAERVEHALQPGVQVEGEADRAGPRVDHAGGADDAGVQLVPGHAGLFDQPGDGRADRADRVGGGRRVHRVLGDDGAGDVGQHDVDLGRADVQRPRVR